MKPKFLSFFHIRTHDHVKFQKSINSRRKVERQFKSHQKWYQNRYQIPQMMRLAKTDDFQYNQNYKQFRIIRPKESIKLVHHN